jgi:hypothetical protein
MSIIAKVLGKFDPADYARKAGKLWVISPAMFYPAMIKHIRASLESQDLPAELVDREVNPEVDPGLAARRYRNWARRITPQAWNDALQPPNLNLGERRAIERAEALECARLWFTRALKNHESGPVHIRILRDDRYRLGIERQFHA